MKRIEVGHAPASIQISLLPVLFAIALSPRPAFAQSPSDAELKAMSSRVVELYQAGKYDQAIPLAERYAASTAARYGQNAPEYASALNNLVLLLRAMNLLAEAEPLMRRALAIDEKSFLGVPEAGLDKAVYLGERATVSKVKALSASGDLARARVVHIATHGLLTPPALIARGGRFAHPSVWAPFVLVGNGGQ